MTGAERTETAGEWLVLLVARSSPFRACVAELGRDDLHDPGCHLMELARCERSCFVEDDLGVSRKEAVAAGVETYYFLVSSKMAQ